MSDERTLEILRNNRAVFLRRSVEWMKKSIQWEQHAKEAVEQARQCDVQIARLMNNHEEPEQTDLIDHIDRLADIQPAQLTSEPSGSPK